MTTENTIDLWLKIDKEREGIEFPKYFVTQPPHRDTLEPFYYKIVSPDGPVFWRKEGADSGKQTSFYDFYMEEASGWGVNELDKQYTPWADD
jgi:hypothetical protein